MELPVYKTEKIIPLGNEDYYNYLLNCINNANRRLYASIFILNALIKDDKELQVRNLIKALSYAKWKNVDVKILTGNSINCNIKLMVETTANYIKELGIPVKQYSSKMRKSLHSKYVIVDDEIVIVGSQNWSHNAFSLSNEDAVAIYSKEQNIILNDEFQKLWKIAKKLEEI